MARNGSGTYSKVNTYSAGNVITAAGLNQNFDDLVAEMTNSVAADGQTTITGALKGASGTVSLPGYSFSADLDCGLYRIGANNIGAAVNGAKVLDISTTGLGVVGTVLNGDGAVGAPAFSYTSDPDSGWYRIGANNMGAAVNGAKVLDVATTGLTVTGAFSATTTVTAGTGLTVTSGNLTVSSGNFSVTGGTVTLPNATVSDAVLATPGAWKVIATNTAGGATVDFASGLDDTYDMYMVAISNLKPATDDVDLWIRIGTGGTPTYQTANYGWASQCCSANAAATNPRASNLADSKMITTANNGTSGVGNASGEHLSGIIRFTNPEASDFVSFWWELSYCSALPDQMSSSGAGRYNVAGAITAVRFLMSSGNISSGRFTLYGLKKS